MSTRTTQKLTVISTWNNGATTTDSFNSEVCCNCSVVFAMTSTQHDQRQADGKEFYCPNGHRQYFAKTDATRLREEQERSRAQMQRMERRLDGALDDAQAQRRTAAALKGHLTRARNRAAAGICPAPGCKRSFHSLAEHVRTEHPSLVDVLPE